MNKTKKNTKSEKASQEENWTAGRSLAICEHCDWRFWLSNQGSAGDKLGRCPHCRQTSLSVIAVDDPEAPPTADPELYLPYQVQQNLLQRRLNEFIGSIRFKPTDLTLANLAKRIEKIYWPMWLVDAEVEGRWEAEIGTDYDVVSHQERFGDGAGWQTREVKETRIRWEPRVGSMRRTYNNVAAPALEEHARLGKRLGRFKLSSPAAYEPAVAEEAHIRMPNRGPADAWPAAAPAVQKAAAEECRQAAEADHIRQFRWSPTYSNQHWTLLLLPLLTTYYLDDEGEPRTLLIHGQTGASFGRKRASPAQGRRSAGIILGIALLIGVLGVVFGALGFVAPPLTILGGLGLIAAVLMGLGAMVPPIIVWQFNKNQQRIEQEQKSL